MGSGRSSDDRSGSLAEKAYYELRERLVNRQIPPGSPIYESQICSEIGLGRTPVREAIKRLESEQLVAIYPRRGIFATDINITDHALLADVRRHLEGLAALRAAERASTEDRRTLRDLRHRLQDTNLRLEDLMGLDREVHSALYRSTGNSYLEKTLGQYYNLASRIWTAFLSRIDVAEHLANHRALLDAVLKGDGKEARDIAMAHVDEFEKTVLSVELEVLGSLRLPSTDDRE